MKTHSLARALRSLSDLLLTGENVDLSRVELSARKSHDMEPREVVLSLDVLVALSRVDKQKWHDFIKEHEFPISVRPRDASRDILGKLLRHLEANPDSLKKLKQRAHRDVEPSQELLAAFQTLLRGQSE